VSFFEQNIKYDYSAKKCTESNIYMVEYALKMNEI